MITLTFENNLITGSVINKKQRIQINVMGIIDPDGTLYLYEFLKKGQTTVTYIVKLKGEIITNSWYDLSKINVKELILLFEKQ